jgi:hypothetical protein
MDACMDCVLMQRLDAGWAFGVAILHPQHQSR